MKKLPETFHAFPPCQRTHSSGLHYCGNIGDKTAKWNNMVNMELEVQQIQVKVSFFKKIVLHIKAASVVNETQSQIVGGGRVTHVLGGAILYCP